MAKDGFGYGTENNQDNYLSKFIFCFMNASIFL